LTIHSNGAGNVYAFKIRYLIERPTAKAEIRPVKVAQCLHISQTGFVFGINGPMRSTSATSSRSLSFENGWMGFCGG
jgi:hypothetical protein